MRRIDARPDSSLLRIGDRERDQAVAELLDHHVAGRLTVEEFDERLSAALSAKTKVGLEALLFDLPTPSGRESRRATTRLDGGGRETPKRLIAVAVSVAALISGLLVLDVEHGPDPSASWPTCTADGAVPAGSNAEGCVTR